MLPVSNLLTPKNQTVNILCEHFLLDLFVSCAVAETVTPLSIFFALSCCKQPSIFVVCCIVGHQCPSTLHSKILLSFLSSERPARDMVRICRMQLGHGARLN